MRHLKLFARFLTSPSLLLEVSSINSSFIVQTYFKKFLCLIFKLLTAHSAYQPAVTDTILLLIDIKALLDLEFSKNRFLLYR